jgi:hypothetical protein
MEVEILEFDLPCVGDHKAFVNTSNASCYSANINNACVAYACAISRRQRFLETNLIKKIDCRKRCEPAGHKVA